MAEVNTNSRLKKKPPTPVRDLSQVRPLQGHTCTSCGAPVDSRDHFCTACGMPQSEMVAPPTPVGHDIPVATAAATRPATVTAEPDLHSFQCQSCSSTITIDPSQRSYVCPFCESTYVVELPLEPGRQRPEFVVGFAITPEQAWEKFQLWLRTSSWLRPLNLRKIDLPEKLRGVYLPFWSFSMLSHAQWRARIGEYWYRTETYTVVVDGKRKTMTRVVTETEWWPLSGNFQRYSFGYLISASHGLPQQYADLLMPYHLSAAKRYEPYFLAGWLSEEYSLDRDQALAHCQQEFAERLQQQIAGFLPGDVQSDLQCRVEFDNISSDLFLLPTYLLNYQYDGKAFRFVMNGQTGEIYGERPISWTRIMVFALVAIAIGLAIGLALR